MFKKQENNSDSQWIPISDLMSVLMMVFLFIAIVYMINVKSQKDKIKKIAVNYNKLRLDLYKDLHIEFKDDLKKWNAEIDSNKLSVKFNAPEVFFKTGKYDISDQFKIILEDFFPRYINILSSFKYCNEIEEIRIEGHTSSEWTEQGWSEIDTDSYFKNMELSQNRTREVLKFVLNSNNIIIRVNKVWIKEVLTANGLSSSKLIKHNGIEDKEASRRVEFKVNTKSIEKIAEILNME